MTLNHQNSYHCKGYIVLAVAQCEPAHERDEVEYGQFRKAVIDAANAHGLIVHKKCLDTDEVKSVQFAIHPKLSHEHDAPDFTRRKAALPCLP